MPPKRKADESNGEAKPRVKKAKSEASGDSAALKKGPWSPEDREYLHPRAASSTASALLDELAITCILSLNPPKMSKEQLTAIGQVVGRDATAMSVSSSLRIFLTFAHTALQNWWRVRNRSMMLALLTSDAGTSAWASP
jgi:hypothetical protein